MAKAKEFHRTETINHKKITRYVELNLTLEEARFIYAALWSLPCSAVNHSDVYDSICGALEAIPGISSARIVDREKCDSTVFLNPPLDVNPLKLVIGDTYRGGNPFPPDDDVVSIKKVRR